MNPKVDFYFVKAQRWQQELELLRTIVLDCGLVEELKWGVPCYRYKEANIVLIHVFKEYCAILFFKGALLKDPDGVLVQQTKNVQAARQIRFTGVLEVRIMEKLIKAYILEAIEVEKAGLKIEYKETKAFIIPEEFQNKLKENLNLKNAFEALTPGRQRAYIFYFSAAKQTKTKVSRIEKYIPQILDGKGLDD